VLEVLDSQIESITVDGKYYPRPVSSSCSRSPPELGASEERPAAIFENIGKLERRLAKIQAALPGARDLTRDLGSKEERYFAGVAGARLDRR
jgi:hypothetical protein